MGRRKGYRVPPEAQIPCPICGLRVNGKSGGIGHVKSEHNIKVENWDEFVAGLEIEENHGANPENQPVKILPNAPSDLKQMQEENQRLRLQRERMLLTGVPSSAVPPRESTITEKVGLGPITEENATLKQKEYLFPPQPNPQETLKQGLEIQKLIQDVAGGKGNGLLDGAKAVLGLLATFGIGGEDIKRGVQNFLNPQKYQTGSMQVEGLVLPAECSEATFNKVLEYKSKVESAKLEADSKDRMTSAMTSTISLLSPLILEKFGDGGSGGGNGSPNRQPREAEPVFVTCTIESCKHKFEVGSDMTIGDNFSCPRCGEEYEYYLPEAAAKKERVQKAPLVQDDGLPTSIECECSQLLQVPADAVAGQWLSCPICGKESPVMSSKPIPPGPALEPQIESGERRE
ncbi:hypothetical protein ACFLWH_01360 [Chloroflexota bacterium]